MGDQPESYIGRTAMVGGGVTGAPPGCGKKSRTVEDPWATAPHIPLCTTSCQTLCTHRTHWEGISPKKSASGQQSWKTAPP